MSKVEEPEGATLTPSEERDTIKALIEDSQALREGDLWYPVDFKWWQVWQNYVQWESEEEVKTSDGSRPDPIDNSGLCKAGFEGVLKFGLREDLDHVLVAQPVWDKLVAWYGGGPAFPRKVVVSEQTFQARVEMYPQYCKVRTVGDDGAAMNDEVIIMLGRSLTAEQALAECCGKLNKVVESSRLWAKVGGQEDFGLVNPVMSMGDIAGEDDFTELLVETQTATGDWKREVPVGGGEAAPEGGDGADGGDAAEDAEPFDEVAWRAGLKVDDRLDAQDSDGKWFESIVREVEPGTDGADDKLLMHYRGWEERWNAWTKRSSAKLQPRFTKVKNFRDFRVNDKIEYKHMNRWFEATVVDLKADKSQVKVKVPKANATAWVDWDAETLCALYTHCKRRAAPVYTDFRKSRTGRPAVPGAVGLQNLGNTCFMNSMLQCLSNTEPLTKFFMSNEYRKDINTNNPLGMGGRLAEAYGSLLQDMWGGEYTVVCPTEFKRQIGAYAPQFAGYQQQDSQELMNFLLDGLHEDLNRVKEKPATDTVESKGRPDGVVAAEAWKVHKLRNRSMVVDTCQGQLKSDVTCDKCGRQSVTFDPFMSLSVPIPVKNLRNLIVTFIPYDGAAPVRYSAKVDKQGAIADLKAWFHETSGFPPDTLVVGDTYHHRIFRFLADSRPLSEIRDNDVIMVYQIPQLPGEPPKAEPKKEGMLASAFNRVTGYGRTKQPSDQELTPNSPGTVHLMYRHAEATHSGGAPTRWLPHGDPRMLSLYAVSGERGKMPTGNQTRAAVLDAIRRLLVRGAELTADELPFTVTILDKSAHSGRAREVTATDEPIDIDPTKEALYVDFSATQYTTDFDFNELVHWEPHSSTDERVSHTDIDVSDCLDMFSRKEQLGENDKWYCGHCREHRQAFKKFDLWKAPEILVIHLKRFSYSQGTYFVHRDKIEHVVNFPMELDLSDRILGPQPLGAQYQLYAVSNHSGGLGGGHYTAYAKNFKNQQWYNFNDSHVSRADPSRLVSSMAYVLFYRRVRPGAKTGAAEAPAAAAAASE